LIRYNQPSWPGGIQDGSGALLSGAKNRLISSQQLKAVQKPICCLFHETDPKICKIDSKVGQNVKTRNFSQNSGQNDLRGCLK
jgi:hypothetical protein